MSAVGADRVAGLRGGLVDAFTDRPFGGNPAGVVLLPDTDAGWPDDAWCQAVAAEVHASETAFLRPLGRRRYALRWFTPVLEVELCGHATLASAHWLWSQGETGRLAFETASGELAADREPDGRVSIELPLVPLDDAPAGVDPAPVLPGVGHELVGVTRIEDPLRRKVLVLLPSADAVRTVRPDLRALAGLPVAGLIVTAAGDEPGVDLVSRFFAPRVGIDEDPVTGSAHCTLAPYWSGRLGRDRLRAVQVSARRGELDLEIRGDVVRLTGAAVTTADLVLRA